MLQNGGGPTGPDQDSAAGPLDPLQTSGRVQRVEAHRQEGIVHSAVQGQRGPNGADIPVRSDAIYCLRGVQKGWYDRI